MPRRPRVLVVTPIGTGTIPAQGALIAERLRGLGCEVLVAGRGDSGGARLADVALVGLLRARSCDVVLVNVFGGRAFVYESLALGYGRWFDRRVVAMLRGGWLHDFADRWPRWLATALGRADARVVPHAFLEAELTRRGFEIDAVIPNFIELERYAFRLRRELAPRLLYMRGFHEIYDPITVVRAFARVQAAVPAASLTMAGKAGPELQACRDLVGSLGLRDVSFVGLVPKSEVAALADAHDLYLQANVVENMPVSVIEMWASGLPVVATRVGGTPYLVRDGEDGLLVPERDPAALGDACLRLLGDPDLAARLSAGGRARACELTWERVGPKWLEVLGIPKPTDSREEAA